MSIIVDQINENVERRYSDIDVKIKKIEDGTLWNDAIDTIPCRFTYVETAQPIDAEEEDATEQDFMDALSSLGVNLNEEE